MTDSITIRVRAFAGLREALGTGETVLEAPVGTNIAGLVALVDAAFPKAHLTTRRYTVAVNRAYAPPSRVLADGDEVGLIPPVSGGSDHGIIEAGSPRPYEITDRPISLDDVAARVAAPELGGITLFAGTVRGVTAGKNGAGESFATDYLEYEAYPEMAEASFAGIAAEAQARWSGISAVAVIHRVGRLEVGDIAVGIAVAAAHRADTFDACRYIIDRIKEIAPIWKREVGPDGASWVEGPESAV
jgi:molybdopterin synthase catalytic subunit